MAPPKIPTPRGAINHTIDYALIKQEEWIQSLYSTLEKPRFKLDASVVKELKLLAAYHENNFEGGKPRLPVVRNEQDLEQLMTENSTCLAHRDRVTEILVGYTAIKYTLDALWERAESRLLEVEAYRQLTNELARKAFANAVLEPLHERRSHIKKVIAMAEILHQHLSHTHFTIKQHAEMGVAIMRQRSA